MYKLKLLAAMAAVGLSGFASADIGGSPASGEFVFSAFDADTGAGYTYELDDAGFDELFARGAAGTALDGVRMSNVIGSTNTTSAVGYTLIQMPTGGVVFDYALPSFTSFLAGANADNVVWNVTSIDVSGLRRLVQTVSTVPADGAPSQYTNSDLIASAATLEQYYGAVNGFIADPVDGFALTSRSDGTAWAGTAGAEFFGRGYASFSSLSDSAAMFVAGATVNSASNSAATLFEQIVDQDGMNVMAKVYMADDGMYHLQISAVPEPSTYAMLLAGLGLLGFAARRARV